jgi:hypothetical protein
MLAGPFSVDVAKSSTALYLYPEASLLEFHVHAMLVSEYTLVPATGAAGTAP